MTGEWKPFSDAVSFRVMVANALAILTPSSITRWTEAFPNCHVKQIQSYIFNSTNSLLFTSNGGAKESQKGSPNINNIILHENAYTVHLSVFGVALESWTSISTAAVVSSVAGKSCMLFNRFWGGCNSDFKFGVLDSFSWVFRMCRVSEPFWENLQSQSSYEHLKGFVWVCRVMMWRSMYSLESLQAATGILDSKNVTREKKENEMTTTKHAQRTQVSWPFE